MIRNAAIAIAAVTALAACEPVPPQNATTGSVGGIPLGPFYLVGLGAEAVPQRDATMVLSAGGMSGTGPCNTYTATNAATLPAVKVSVMNWTDLSCPGLEFENRYFHQLTQAQSMRYEGELLIVTTPELEMTFEAGTPVATTKLGR